MRKLTSVLLGGASILLASVIALLIWRASGMMAAAAAGLAAGLALARAPQSGGLFRITGLGVKGAPSPRVAG